MPPRAVALSCVVALGGCSPGDGATYTLYRNSALDQSMRVHVATFDSSDGEDYNDENCNVAQQLFQRQGGVTVRYWCEKGRFRS